MAKDFAKAFYKSRDWVLCRDGYIAMRRGLCERCLARGIIHAGKIVHHKVWLTPDNITNPAVSLNWDNLELLCQDCHNAEHIARTQKRFRCDAAGNIIPLDAAGVPPGGGQF